MVPRSRAGFATCWRSSILSRLGRAALPKPWPGTGLNPLRALAGAQLKRLLNLEMPALFVPMSITWPWADKLEVHGTVFPGL